VVGGTGPTGPGLVSGLQARGYDVTVFHTGRHEDGIPEGCVHVHGNPFEATSIGECLDGLRPDLVIATYGRIAELARQLAGRTARLVTVSGYAVYAGFTRADPAAWPLGLPVSERDPRTTLPPAALSYPSDKIAATEDVVMALHHDGAFSATTLRYPNVYGPRSPVPMLEWSVIRRVLDARSFMFVVDGGLSMHTRVAVANAVASVLAVIDAPERTGGAVFNVADARQYSQRDWIRAICAHVGRELELVPLPGSFPSPAWATFPFGYDKMAPHLLVDDGALRAATGHEDVVDPLDALRTTVDWYLDVAGSDALGVGPDTFDYETEDALLAAHRDYEAAMVGLVPDLVSYYEPSQRRSTLQRASSPRG
jgi:nucleoside-diphosphate-sugar epimerase